MKYAKRYNRIFSYLARNFPKLKLTEIHKVIVENKLLDNEVK